MAQIKAAEGSDLDQLLKRIDFDIKSVFSYGDKSGVNAKDINKKVNDKLKLAELAFNLFEHLVDCQDSIKLMLSRNLEKADIASKLTSIEKTMQETTRATNEALKEVAATTQSLQKDIKDHQEEQKNVADNIKSYSDALQSDSKSGKAFVDSKVNNPPIDLGKLHKVVKKSMAEVHSQRDRSCRVMFFGISNDEGLKDPDFDYDYVKKMLFNINVDENSLVSVDRIGKRVPHRVEPDSRPIRATLRDSGSARECLKKAPALKTESYEHVYMARDLSKSEQMKQKELVKQLKTKIANENSRYILDNQGR